MSSRTARTTQRNQGLVWLPTSEYLKISCFCTINDCMRKIDKEEWSCLLWSRANEHIGIFSAQALYIGTALGKRRVPRYHLSILSDSLTLLLPLSLFLIPSLPIQHFSIQVSCWLGPPKNVEKDKSLDIPGTVYQIPKVFSGTLQDLLAHNPTIPPVYPSMCFRLPHTFYISICYLQSGGQRSGALTDKSKGENWPISSEVGKGDAEVLFNKSTATTASDASCHPKTRT